MDWFRFEVKIIVVILVSALQIIFGFYGIPHVGFQLGEVPYVEHTKNLFCSPKSVSCEKTIESFSDRLSSTLRTGRGLFEKVSEGSCLSSITFT